MATPEAKKAAAAATTTQGASLDSLSSIVVDESAIIRAMADMDKDRSAALAHLKERPVVCQGTCTIPVHVTEAITTSNMYNSTVLTGRTIVGTIGDLSRVCMPKITVDTATRGQVDVAFMPLSRAGIKDNGTESERARTIVRAIQSRVDGTTLGHMALIPGRRIRFFADDTPDARAVGKDDIVYAVSTVATMGSMKPLPAERVVRGKSIKTSQDVLQVGQMLDAAGHMMTSPVTPGADPTTYFEYFDGMMDSSPSAALIAAYLNKDDPSLTDAQRKSVELVFPWIVRIAGTIPDGTVPCINMHCAFFEKLTPGRWPGHLGASYMALYKSGRFVDESHVLREEWIRYSQYMQGTAAQPPQRSFVIVQPPRLTQAQRREAATLIAQRMADPHGRSPSNITLQINRNLFKGAGKMVDVGGQLKPASPTATSDLCAHIGIHGCMWPVGMSHADAEQARQTSDVDATAHVWDDVVTRAFGFDRPERATAAAQPNCLTCVEDWIMLAPYIFAAAHVAMRVHVDWQQTRENAKVSFTNPAAINAVLFVEDIWVDMPEFIRTVGFPISHAAACEGLNLARTPGRNTRIAEDPLPAFRRVDMGTAQLIYCAGRDNVDTYVVPRPKYSDSHTDIADPAACPPPGITQAHGDAILTTAWYESGPVRLSDGTVVEATDPIRTATQMYKDCEHTFWLVRRPADLESGADSLETAIGIFQNGGYYSRDGKPITDKALIAELFGKDKEARLRAEAEREAIAQAAIAGVSADAFSDEASKDADERNDEHTAAADDVVAAAAADGGEDHHPDLDDATTTTAGAIPMTDEPIVVPPPSAAPAAASAPKHQSASSGSTTMTTKTPVHPTKPAAASATAKKASASATTPAPKKTASTKRPTRDGDAVSASGADTPAEKKKPAHSSHKE